MFIFIFMKEEDIWDGYVDGFDVLSKVMIRIKKDYNLDKEVTIDRSCLTNEQNKIVRLGTFARFDLNNNVLYLMSSNDQWLDNSIKVLKFYRRHKLKKIGI